MPQQLTFLQPPPPAGAVPAWETLPTRAATGDACAAGAPDASARPGPARPPAGGTSR